MELIVNNFGAIIAILIIIIAVVGIFLFTSIKKKKWKKDEKEHMEMYSLPIDGNISILNFRRLETNKISIEYNNQGESSILEINFANKDDQKKFELLFSADRRFDYFNKQKDNNFVSENILSDVSRYLKINLKNVNDSISFEDLFKNLEKYFAQKSTILNNLNQLSRGVQQ